MNASEKRVHALLVLFFVLCGVASRPAGAQQVGTLLIVSQADPNAGKNEPFIDFADYLRRAVEESGRFKPLVFEPSLPAIRAALDARQLAASEITKPLSREAIRKVADIVGANHTLRVSGRSTKDGIAVEAEMEAQVARNLWTTAFLTRLEPYRTKGKRPRPTEAIYAHVASLVERITAVRTGGGKPMDPRTTPPPVEKTTPAPSPDTRQEKLPVPPPSDPPKAATPPERKATQSTTEAVQPAVSVANPNTPSAHEILVDRFRRQGDLTNLIISLRHAINDKPRDVRLRRDLIQAYKERGWSEAARDEARRAVALAPNDPMLHRLLGDGHLAADDIESAIQEYQEAVRLDSKDGANLVALGNAYWQNARPEEAQKAYAEAVQADPKNPLPHRRLARLYAQQGRFADCVAAMSQAKTLTPPDDMDALYEDCAALLTFADTGLSDVLEKLRVTRKALRDGTRTREEVFKDTSAQKKRAEELANFLDALPAPERFARVQALYVQAANLVIQAVEGALLVLETGDSRRDEEATLLRLEAGKQIAEAAKRLKALTAKREK